MSHSPAPAPAVTCLESRLYRPPLARSWIVRDGGVMFAIGNAEGLAAAAEVEALFHGIADGPMAHAILQVDQLDLPFRRGFEFGKGAQRNNRRDPPLSAAEATL